MQQQTLREAVFRLGQLSADRALTNSSLLHSLVDILLASLGIDAAGLAVYERGADAPSTECCVRSTSGATSNGSEAWALGDPSLARRLSGLRRGRLYHRPDLIAEREIRHVRLAGENRQPFNSGDQALALFRRADGAELLLAISTADESGRFSRSVLAKAGALVPYIAQCWAAAWRAEPVWMSDLKPQGRLILENLLQGFDDDQIAARTGLSYHSVRAHLKRLFRDAGVRSRLHLMQACKRDGCAPALDAYAQSEADAAVLA